MTLKDEFEDFKLVTKRILKTKLSTNPITLRQYLTDIIFAHNKFINYIKKTYPTPTESDQTEYYNLLIKVNEKTSECFERLQISYEFTSDILELIDIRHFIGDDNSNNTDSNTNNINKNMTQPQQTVAEFLTIATKLIPEFNGAPENLQSFIDALELLNISVGPHVDIAIKLIKSKLRSTARDYITNEADILAIITTLINKIKPDSVSLLTSKLMSVQQGSRKVNAYVAEIETLTKDLKRAYIKEGSSLDFAEKYSTKAALQSLKTNATDSTAKITMNAITSTDLNEVLQKFIETNNDTLTTNNAQINYFHKRGGRGHRYNSNSNYYRGNYNRNYQSYRNNNNNNNNNNYRNNYRGNRGNNRSYRGNNRGRNYNNYSNNNSQIRVMQDDADNPYQGNQSSPQHVRMLRES